MRWESKLFFRSFQGCELAAIVDMRVTGRNALPASKFVRYALVRR